MHRFNALTFTYVCVVCAQLPPRLLPLPHSPPASAPHPLLSSACSSSLTSSWAWAHWRWRLPQYVPTNYVYSRLQASDMHRQTNLEPQGTGKLSLGHGWGLDWVCGCGSGSAHRGVPRHQRQRHQRIDSALWHFGFLGG